MVNSYWLFVIGNRVSAISFQVSGVSRLVQRFNVQRLDNGRRKSDVEGQNSYPFNL
jgi:hypothetical protein